MKRFIFGLAFLLIYSNSKSQTVKADSSVSIVEGITVKINDGTNISSKVPVCEECEEALFLYRSAFLNKMTFTVNEILPIISLIQLCQINNRSCFDSAIEKTTLNYLLSNAPESHKFNSTPRWWNSDWNKKLIDSSNKYLNKQIYKYLKETDSKQIVKNFKQLYLSQLAPSCDECISLFKAYDEARKGDKVFDPILKELVIKCIFQKSYSFVCKKICQDDQDVMTLISTLVDRGGSGIYGDYLRHHKWKIDLNLFDNPKTISSKSFLEVKTYTELGVDIFKSNELWGVKVDNFVFIEPKYDDIKPVMLNNIVLYVVKLNSKFGLLSSTGEELVKPIFDEIIVNTGKNIQWRGDYKESFVGKIQNGNYILYKQDRRYGLIYRNGNSSFIIRPTSIDNVILKSNAAIISSNRKFGFINQAFTRVVNPIYDSINISSNFDDYKSALFKQNGKWGLLDINNGKEICSAKYDEIRLIENQYAQVKSNNKWGIIDINGGKTIEPNYDEAFNFTNDFALVKLNGSSFKIDINGNKVLLMKVDNSATVLNQNEASSKIISPNQKCSVIFQLPSLPFKYIDNRQICIYCRERYVPYKKIDVNEYKKGMTLTYVTNQIDKHCEEVGADNNHKASHIIQIGNLCVKKGYFKSTEDAVSSIIAGDFIVNQVTDYFGGIIKIFDMLQSALGNTPTSHENNDFSIKLYENDNTKFCTKKHEDCYYGRCY